MNRDESIALFERCEAARKEAQDAGASENEAHEKAKAVWNGWAEGLLAERKKLEESGEWEAEREFGSSGKFIGKNEKSIKWFAKAKTDLSIISFQNNKKKVLENPTSSTHSDENNKVILCNGLVNFSGYIFPSDAYFNSTKFCGYSKFWRATFLGYTYFYGAFFLGNANFQNITCLGTAHFAGTTFQQYATFSNAQFSDTTLFTNATFESYVEFSNVKFLRDARFYSSTFLNSSDFEYAIFSKDARFIKATFSETARFSHANFLGYANFTRVAFKSFAYFSGTLFNTNSSFHAIDCKAPFNLSNARFKVVPDFLDASFKNDEPPNLDNVKVETKSFWNFRYYTDTTLATKFRKLKKMAIQAHYNDGELEFHAQELRHSRFVVWWGWPVPKVLSPGFWFGIFYGVFSNFGRSVLRPLVAWAALIVIFSTIYLCEHPSIKAGDVSLAKAWLGEHSCVPANLQKDSSLSHVKLARELLPETSPQWEAVDLAVKNGFVFIDWDRQEAALRTFGCLYGLNETKTTLVPKVPWVVSFANTVQNVLSVILIFLFGLGLRNMLKLK